MDHKEAWPNRRGRENKGAEKHTAVTSDLSLSPRPAPSSWLMGGRHGRRLLAKPSHSVVSAASPYKSKYLEGPYVLPQGLNGWRQSVRFFMDVLDRAACFACRVGMERLVVASVQRRGIGIFPFFRNSCYAPVETLACRQANQGRKKIVDRRRNRNNIAACCWHGHIRQWR